MDLNKKPFYLYWSISFLLVVAVAFAPKYWFPLFDSNTEITTDIHFHAFFATAWILMYLTQVMLIKSKRFSIHQTLGFLSIALAIGVIISGFYVSIGLAERALLSNPAGAKPLLLVNLLDLVMFGILFYLAIKNRRISIRHKRFVTLATIALMNAAYFRIGRFIIGPGFGSVLLAIFITSSVIIFFLWSEKRFSNKPNKTFWWIASGIIFVHIIRIPIAITPFWTNIADILIDNF